MHRSISINLVTKIEYAEFSTEADMNLYEIYFINLWKPPLNIDDKCKDNLTVSLPDVEWKTFTTHLWDKWKNEIAIICYEKPFDFCHRHLVADWLQNRGFDVEEYKF